MALKKFTAEFSDRAHADATGNALQDLIEPPPDALTVFENGPGHWRLDVYFDETAGDRDLAVAFSGGEAMVAGLKDVVPQLRDARLLPGCGHWTQQERPDEVNAAMLEFIAGLG